MTGPRATTQLGPAALQFPRIFLIVPQGEQLFAAGSIICTLFDACRPVGSFALRYIIQGFASKPAPGLILIRSLNGAQFLDQFQQ
jgi:hypothetical protein